MELRFPLHSAISMALFTVALFGQTTAQAGNYRIVQDWRASVVLPGTSSRYVSRVAICPDGSSYLSDGRGRLIQVDPEGRKAYDQSGIAVLESVRSLACDQRDRAVASLNNPSSIVILQPEKRGDFALVARLSPKPLTIPVAILVLPENLGYATLAMGSGQKNPIHVLSPSGEIQWSFGSFPVGMSEELFTQASLRGFLLWDRSSQSILYISSHSYELTAFTLDGQLLGKFTRVGAGLNAANFDQSSGRPLPSDRIVGAAMLPNGDLLVEIVKYEVIGPMTVKSSGYLEVVDVHLRSKSGPIDPGDYGILSGSDAKGNIYFSFTSQAEGTKLIKAHVFRGE